MGKFIFTQTEIPGVVVIEPQVFGDDRGYFMETYQIDEFAAAGIDSHLTYRVTQPVLRERGGLVYRAFGTDAADGAHHAVNARAVKRKVRIVIGVPCAIIVLKAEAARVLEAQRGHGVGIEREHGGAVGVVITGVQLRVQL